MSINNFLCRGGCLTATALAITFGFKIAFHGFDFIIFGVQTNRRPATFLYAKTAPRTFVIVDDNSAVGRSPATVQIGTAITVAAVAATIAIGTSLNFPCSVGVATIAIKEFVVNRLVYFYVADRLYGTTLNRRAYLLARKTSSEIYNRFHSFTLHLSDSIEPLRFNFHLMLFY